MIPIPNVEQIRNADKFTIENEPVSSIDLMERAANACTNWLIKKIKNNDKVLIVCGPGNNGGDGLAIARQLIQHQIFPEVFIPGIGIQNSQDFMENLSRLNSLIKVTSSDNCDEIPDFKSKNVIIDCLFGSGLNKAVTGLAHNVIERINESNAIVVSIDIPSGLFTDRLPDANSIAVKADYTLSFEFPKLSFLLAELDNFVGDWHILPIGLHIDFVSNMQTKYYLLNELFFKNKIYKRSKFAHKGNFGHGLLIAGSHAKNGAALLAAKSCLRTGIGLLTTHTNESAKIAFNCVIPECMLSLDTGFSINSLPKIEFYNAIGIGPGIGLENQTQNVLKLLIQESKVPLILDADALNILAENKTWLSFLPQKTILTPHPLEFDRLFGKSPTSFDRIKLQIEMSEKYNVIIVLKGAYTSISIPGNPLYFNSTGNPGMATAGSGDVLTGIILSLLAQKYKAEDAALLGVYIHGKAGDLAALNLSQQSMIASDIIDYLPAVFLG